VEGTEGFSGGECVVFRDFCVLPASTSLANRKSVGGSLRLRRVNIVLGDSQCPDDTLSVPELLKQCAIILLEVLMDDDVDFILVALGHWDRTSAEDGDAADALHAQHLVQHSRTDESGRTCQYEMHAVECILSKLPVGSVGGR